MKTKIVLLNGQKLEADIGLLALATFWECLRNGSVSVVVVPAIDDYGVKQMVNVRKIDPAKTFGDIGYEKTRDVEDGRETLKPTG